MTVTLNKSLTKLGFAVIAINGLIGAGIFTLPGAALQQSGSLSPWLFLLCALLIAPIVLSFALLSSKTEQTGGPVQFTYQAFGPFVAFQTGWLLYLGRLTALAANSNAIVLYLSLLLPVLQQPVIKAACISVIIAMLALVNYRGIGSAVKTVKVFTVLKLLPLLIFVAAGAIWLAGEPAADTSLDSELDMTGLPAMLLLLLYAYIGFEGAAVPAGEAKKPQKDIPIALVSTLVVTALLYFAIQTIVVGLLPGDYRGNAPLSDAASVIFGPVGATVMTLTAIFSIAGNLSSVMLAAPRMTYALAEEKALPAWFGHLHPDHQTPNHSIILFAVLAVILATTGSFIWLAILSSLARLIGYGLCILASYKLDKGTYKDEFTLPFGLFIPTLALVICIWLMAQASLKAWLLTLCFAALGAGLYRIAKSKG